MGDGTCAQFTTRHSSRNFRSADHFIHLRFSPKEVSMPRTTGWTLLHLRDTTLIAILIANLALIGIFAPSAQAASSTKEIYGYSCCGGGFGTVNYHPGETIKIDWIRTSLRSSAAPAKTVNLSLSASCPFPTLAAAKKAFSGSHPALGHTIFAA